MENFSKLYSSLLILGVLTLIVLFSSHLLADGSNAGSIFVQSLGARAQGMGEMFSSVSVDEGDVTALQYNPASIAFLNYKEVAMSYKGGIFGDKLGVLCYGSPIGKERNSWESFAGTFLYYSVGETDFVDSGNVKRTVNAEKDYGFIFSYSKQFWKNFSLGTNGKVLRSQLLEKFTATAFAVDIGSMYKIGSLSVGGAIQNIGTGLRYENRKEDIPVTFRAGISHQNKYFSLHKMLAGVDIIKRRTESVKANLGLEYVYDDEKFPLASRFGYKLGEDTGNVNFGFGFKARSYKIDYSLQVVEESGNSHFITFRYTFGDTSI